MKTRTLVIAGLLSVTAAVVAANQAGYPVPGLEWVRVDGGASKSTAAGGDKSDGKTAGRSGGRRGGGDGAVPVVVAKTGVDDVPVYLRGVGTARAPNTVTVKPQVDGRLIKVHFREGQDVKRGDLLAEIDPVTYQASLDQAVAKRKLTESQLANAKLDLERYDKVGPSVTPQKTIDTQRAQVAQYEAQLKSDTAAIANAQAVLDYTRISSPIDGRTGQRLVDEGNLVRSGDAGLVTIAQIHPIQVQFTLPQQQLAQVMEAMKAGPVQTEAMDADDRKPIDAGALTFIDNQIDTTTGTVRMKADLPNDRLQLWPGQFANVRVRVDVLKNAVTAPTAAVQRGPQGTFVYVLKDDAGEGAKATVALRTIKVAQQDDRTAVIASGLERDESVVTSGFARLKDGAEVTVMRSPAGPSGDQPAAPAAPKAEADAGQAAAGPETGAAGDTGRRLRRAEGEGTKADRSGKRPRTPESAVQ